MRYTVLVYLQFFRFFDTLFKPVWVAPPRIGAHSDSATLPPWWVDIRTGLENQDKHAILRILLTVSFCYQKGQEQKQHGI